MSVKVQRLRVLVNERLTAAAEEIFALFERTIAEYEEEMCRSKEENKRKQQLLDSGLQPQVLLHRTDAQIQVVSLNIKEEQQNYISLQKVQPPESASTAVQRQTEENREDAEAEDISSTDPQGHLESETERRAESNEVWEPPCSSSDQQKATEADGDDTDQVRKEHLDNPAAAQNSGLFTKSKNTGKKRSRGTILGERICNIMHDCEVCGDKFRGNGGNLRRHMLVHKRARPFSCSVCKTGFTQEDQLEEHMETHRDNDKEESVLLQQKKTEEDRERTEGEDCGGAEIGMSLDSNTSGPEREAEKTENKEPDQQMETEADGDDCSQVHKEESDKPTAAQNPGLFTKSKSKEKNSVQKCNVMHECEVCGDKIRGNSGNFQRHMLVHKRERPFSCSVCKTGFTLEAQLEEHIETHRDNDKESVLLQQKQTEENREDTEGEDMNNGISAGKKVNQCSVCVKTFTTKARLTRHMSVHTGEKPYNCPVCKKSFAQKYNLQTHMPVHTGEKPFSCSACQKSYRRKDDLRTHMSTHTGEVLFSCLVCNAGFRQRNSLRTHMRIHTGDRPFRCSLCSKSFVQKSNFNRHMAVHTGEKPFGCPVCPQRFIQKSDVHKHMMVHP